MAYLGLGEVTRLVHTDEDLYNAIRNAMVGEFILDQRSGRRWLVEMVGGERTTREIVDTPPPPLPEPMVVVPLPPPPPRGNAGPILIAVAVAAVGWYFVNKGTFGIWKSRS